jgi:hypothetical protein
MYTYIYMYKYVYMYKHTHIIIEASMISDEYGQLTLYKAYVYLWICLCI